MIIIIVIIQTANVLLVKTESTARKEESDAKRDNHCWTGSSFNDYDYDEYDCDDVDASGKLDNYCWTGF